MKEEGLVTGEEKGGQINENYSYVSLYSLNAPFDEGGDALTIYTPDGSTGTPTSVIIFEKNQTVFWYSFSGEANGKGGRPTVPELIEIIESAYEVRNDL
jgi:hypothetical protein